MPKQRQEQPSKAQNRGPDELQEQSAGEDRERAAEASGRAQGVSESASQFLRRTS